MCQNYETTLKELYRILCLIWDSEVVPPELVKDIFIIFYKKKITTPSAIIKQFACFAMPITAVISQLGERTIDSAIHLRPIFIDIGQQYWTAILNGC